MRLFTTCLELAGMASLSYGAHELAPWLGFVVAGACLILVGAALGREA